MSDSPPLKLAELLALSDHDLSDILKAAVECYAEEDFVKTEAILMGLLSVDPNHLSGLKLLASTLLLQDRHREAEIIYQRAHTLDPADLYVLGALAEIKLRALKLQEAIPLFEKLFEADPNHEHPAANRGRDIVHDYHKKVSQG